MSEYQSIESYADHIRRETSRWLGAMCNRMGADHPATIAMAELCTEAANIVQAKKMREEQAGGYDLASLSVNASVPSNSETGFEDRG